MRLANRGSYRGSCLPVRIPPHEKDTPDRRFIDTGDWSAFRRFWAANQPLSCCPNVMRRKMELTRVIDKAWRETTRLSRWLAVFALANLMIVTALLIALPSTGWREGAPYDTASFVAFRMSFDSWEPIREAWVYLQDPSDKAVYQAVFFDAGTKFQYALTSLLPYEVVMLVLPGDEQHFWPLDMVSWFAMWATAGLVAMIFLRSLDTYAPEYAPRSTAERLLLGATAAGMTLTFYPLAKAASLGQIQTWINALFAVLVWLWITRRPVHAGI